MRALLAAPALLAAVLLLVLPLVLMGYVSTLERNPNGGVVWAVHSAQAWISVLWDLDFDGKRILNTDSLRIFGRSLLVAALTTVITFVIALPTALWMVGQPPRRRMALLFLVTVPFWTNVLVRAYAWVLLLRAGGLVDQAVAPLVPGGLGLLYTPTAIALGMTYAFLPLMLLPIYLSLEAIDPRLIEAAADLYAGRRRMLLRVVLPLARPGIVAGMALVFVPALGSFVTPELLGGGKALLIGNLIQGQFGALRNWPLGAAMAIVLLLLALAVLRAGVRR